MERNKKEKESSKILWNSHGPDNARAVLAPQVMKVLPKPEQSYFLLLKCSEIHFSFTLVA